MTAEVAIANKLAVALAADSIVTITGKHGDKTYNATNKLFTLSKFHPVGILIYGSATINGIPLEIAIKEFRQLLGKKECRHLGDYSILFLKFLHEKLPIKNSDQSSNYQAVAAAYCQTLLNEVRDRCLEQRISLVAPNDRQKFFATIRECAKQFSDIHKHVGKAAFFKRVTPQGLARLYPKAVERQVAEEFGGYALSRGVLKVLSDAVYAALLSNFLSDRKTGFVVAGYGKSDYYPIVECYETDGFFANKMKLVPSSKDKVEHGNEAFIYPFAQRDAAVLFMEGVDPLYQEYIEKMLRHVLSGLADMTAAHFKVKDAKAIEKARRILDQLFQDFSDDLQRKRVDLFVSRTLDAVEFLDKNEIAILAESFVSLTALRQRVSLDIETVGGPIDVAVISKGDGFVWVKRKHYFSAEFNPFFMQKYLDTATKRTK